MSGRPAGSSGEAGTLQRVAGIFGGTGFRRFFAARAISQFGDGLFQLAAAAVLLFEDPGENPVLRLLAIVVVTLIPFSVISPFVGVFIDRWERHKILTRVPLLRAGVAATGPLIAAIWGTNSAAFYAMVLFVLSSNRFFLATMSAVLPQLVHEEDLLVANSASTTGGSIANVAGQGLGSAIAGLIGGTMTGALAAAGFGFSALAARRVPAHRGFIPDRAPLWSEIRQVLAEMRGGIRAVRAEPRVIYALAAVGTVQILVGALTGILTYYFIAELQLEIGASLALLLGILATGIGIGVVVVPLAARYVRHERLIPAAFALAALGALLGLLDLSRTMVLVGAWFAGVSYAFAKIPVDTIVQEEMADAFRGRAFAVYDMLFNVARVAGIAVVAIAYERGGETRSLIGSVGAAYVIAAIGFAIWERRIGMGSLFRRKKQQRRAPDAGDLLLPGELVTVRAYAGARADEEPRAIAVGGHEIPIDEIEWRAVVEESGRRSRVFVVRAGGRRIRLAYHDNDGWEIERVLPLPPPPAE